MLLHVPKEVFIEHIYCHFTIKETVSTLGRVCSQFYEISTDKYIWKQLCHQYELTDFLCPKESVENGWSETLYTKFVDSFGEFKEKVDLVLSSDRKNNEPQSTRYIKPFLLTPPGFFHLLEQLHEGIARKYANITYWEVIHDDHPCSGKHEAVASCIFRNSSSFHRRVSTMHGLRDILKKNTLTKNLGISKSSWVRHIISTDYLRQSMNTLMFSSISNFNFFSTHNDFLSFAEMRSLCLLSPLKFMKFCLSGPAKRIAASTHVSDLEFASLCLNDLRKPFFKHLQFNARLIQHLVTLSPSSKWSPFLRTAQCAPIILNYLFSDSCKPGRNFERFTKLLLNGNPPSYSRDDLRALLLGREARKLMLEYLFGNEKHFDTILRTARCVFSEEELSDLCLVKEKELMLDLLSQRGPVGFVCMFSFQKEARWRAFCLGEARAHLLKALLDGYVSALQRSNWFSDEELKHVLVSEGGEAFFDRLMEGGPTGIESLMERTERCAFVKQSGHLVGYVKKRVDDVCDVLFWGVGVDWKDQERWKSFFLSGEGRPVLEERMFGYVHGFRKVVRENGRVGVFSRVEMQGLAMGGGGRNLANILFRRVENFEVVVSLLVNEGSGGFFSGAEVWKMMCLGWPKKFSELVFGNGVWGMEKVVNVLCEVNQDEEFGKWVVGEEYNRDIVLEIMDREGLEGKVLRRVVGEERWREWCVREGKEVEEIVVDEEEKKMNFGWESEEEDDDEW